MIIGVTGYFAAGKDTCAEYLEQKGYQHISLSDIIREELRERKLEITLPNLTATGNDLRREFGSGVLAERALEQFRPDTDYVVTSIRHPDEVNALREADCGFSLIFIDAPLEVRFERSRARDRSGDEQTFEAFAAAEKAQLAGGDPATQQLKACRDSADSVINNDSTLEVFLGRIESTLGNL